MIAGRELDALVAEQVMGMVLPDTLWVRPSEISTEEAALIILPAYSTSIAAAWEVVEHVHLFAEYKFEQGRDGTWSVWKEGRWSDGSEDRLLFQDKPICEAICLAALKAVGCELPSETA